MSIPSNYTRSEGFPQTVTGINGHGWIDQFYCNYVDESSLMWAGDDSGSECPFDKRLVLGEARGKRSTSYVYFDVSYVPYDCVPPPVDSFKPTFELRGGLGTTPLKNRPNYKTKWNYNLCSKLDGSGNTQALPSFFDTATTTEIPSGFDKTQIKWCSGDPPTGWAIIDGGSKTKNGVDDITTGVITLDEVYYFSDRKKAMSFILDLNKIKDPKTTIPIAGGWFVSGFSLLPDVKKLVFRINYQFAPASTKFPRGFDTELYDVAT